VSASKLTGPIPIYYTKIYSHDDQAGILCAEALNAQTAAGQNLPVLVQDSCICTGHTSKYMTRTGSYVPFLSGDGVRGVTSLSTIFAEPVSVTCGVYFLFRYFPAVSRLNLQIRKESSSSRLE